MDTDGIDFGHSMSVDDLLSHTPIGPLQTLLGMFLWYVRVGDLFPPLHLRVIGGSGEGDWQRFNQVVGRGRPFGTRSTGDAEDVGGLSS